jgi:hypothetical protein
MTHNLRLGLCLLVSTLITGIVLVLLALFAGPHEPCGFQPGIALVDPEYVYGTPSTAGNSSDCCSDCQQVSSCVASIWDSNYSSCDLVRGWRKIVSGSQTLLRKNADHSAKLFLAGSLMIGIILFLICIVCCRGVPNNPLVYVYQAV